MPDIARPAANQRDPLALALRRAAAAATLAPVRAALLALADRGERAAGRAAPPTKPLATKSDS